VLDRYPPVGLDFDCTSRTLRLPIPDVDTLGRHWARLDKEAAALEIASLRRRIAELDRRIAENR
jgi:hypothetical protein